jgi:hypothetical protein
LDIDSVFCRISDDFKDQELDMIYNEMVLAVCEWYRIIKQERENLNRE